MSLLRTALVGIALAMAGSPAMAAPIVYYNDVPDESNLDLTNSLAARNAFLATLSSFGEDNLDGDTHFAGEEDPPLSFGATLITATTNFNFIVGLSFYAASGDNSLYDTGIVGGQPTPDTILFNKPITAFGAYYVQGGDDVKNTFTFTLENTILGTSKTVSRTIGPDWPFFGVNFFGFTDTDPFNKLTLTETEDVDGLIFDNFLAGYVAPVPEPSTLLLSGVGAALVAIAHRRRLRRQA